MAPSPREEFVRAAPRGAMTVSMLVPVLVPTLVLLALVPGTAAMPFTVVATARNQELVHVGGGVYFPQLQMDVQCPDLPGLQCRSQVDGHRIIITVTHTMTQGEGPDSEEETHEKDTTSDDVWRPFPKPDRVSEVSNAISEDSEFEESLTTTEKQPEEEYGDSDAHYSGQEDPHKDDTENLSEHNSEPTEKEMSDINGNPPDENNSEPEYSAGEGSYDNSLNVEFE